MVQGQGRVTKLAGEESILQQRMENVRGTEGGEGGFNMVYTSVPGISVSSTREGGFNVSPVPSGDFADG